MELLEVASQQNKLFKNDIIFTKGNIMRVSKIKDNNGNDYIIKDIETFHRHIQDYHSSGTSLHEENGHYFTVDDAFRSKIETLYQNQS